MQHLFSKQEKKFPSPFAVARQLCLLCSIHLEGVLIMKVSIRILLLTLALNAVCSQVVAATPPKNVSAAINKHLTNMAMQRGEQERYFNSGMERCDEATQKMTRDYMKVVKTVIGRDDFQNIFITSVLECAKERTKAPEKVANLEAFAESVCKYWANATDNAKWNDTKIRFQEQWDIANKAKKKIAAGEQDLPIREPVSKPGRKPAPRKPTPTASKQTTSAQTPKVEKRIWTSGEFTVEATLVKVTPDGKSVVLRKSNNKEVTVPIEKLSTADRKFVSKNK